MQTATFGAGSFWRAEAAFRSLDGVRETTVGFMGGTLAHPTYRQVHQGRTGHVEVVQVAFDPSTISYDELLDAFFDLQETGADARHDPLAGPAYRSVIFTHDAAQATAARAAVERRRDQAEDDAPPLTTEVRPAQTFWPADDYHQRYLEKRGLARPR